MDYAVSLWHDGSYLRTTEVLQVRGVNKYMENSACKPLVSFCDWSKKQLLTPCKHQYYYYLYIIVSVTFFDLFRSTACLFSAIATFDTQCRPWLSALPSLATTPYSKWSYCRIELVLFDTLLTTSVLLVQKVVTATIRIATREPTVRSQYPTMNIQTVGKGSYLSVQRLLFECSKASVWVFKVS